MLTLYKPYKTVVRTRRDRENIISDLKARAIFKENNFRIRGKTFSLYRGTRVVGQIESDMGLNTITFTVYPSSEFKALSLLIFYAPILASLIFLIIETINNKVDMKVFGAWILATIVLSVLVYFIMKGCFRFSAYLQEESIKGLISN
ncbi:MAG: hypothetical protein ABI663_06200 [Chryseolinea sp.]